MDGVNVVNVNAHLVVGLRRRGNYKIIPEMILELFGLLREVRLSLLDLQYSSVMK